MVLKREERLRIEFLPNKNKNKHYCPYNVVNTMVGNKILHASLNKDNNATLF